ncbi:hypothetical protein JCM24511_04292 [Saitozyma sp. JCM 24511]|nr:hypothetical protein JCM24511_04292 [Saitozyma sp. JCM 24511]
MTDRPPSQIPVAVNRRASVNSVLQQSTNAGNGSPSSPRAQSPLATSNGKAHIRNGKASPMGANRRHSLLTGLANGKVAEPTDSEDPAQLRAQIARLKNSLEASHQRVVELSAAMNIEPSIPGSPKLMSPRIPTLNGPRTPVYGLVGLPEAEGSTPGNDWLPPHSPIEEDIQAESREAGEDQLRTEPSLQRLPHSSPSYDLRSSAITPGKTPAGERILDGRLGLSRIPVSTVTHAASLLANSPVPSPSAIPRPASRGQMTSPSPTFEYESSLRSPFLGPNSPSFPHTANDTRGLGLGQPGLEGRLSPNVTSSLRRVTGPPTSAASTRVIDGLQTELLNLRTHLDRVKQEARSHQRVIGQLTRQSEDLKETRERMRIECESQNNVIARKERLLQGNAEVLERARTAEASLAQHVSTRKALEQSTKKSLQQMTAQLAESQSAQIKAERECNSLKDSVRSLREAWSRELRGVRDEWKRGEERNRKEREEARLKHITLVKLVQSQSAERQSIQQLAAKASQQSADVNTAFEAQLVTLKTELERSFADSQQAKETAEYLAGELVRLRRMMREPSPGDIAAIARGENATSRSAAVSAA